jgi:hypothetical protein
MNPSSTPYIVSKLRILLFVVTAGEVLRRNPEWFSIERCGPDGCESQAMMNAVAIPNLQIERVIVASSG